MVTIQVKYGDDFESAEFQKKTFKTKDDALKWYAVHSSKIWLVNGFYTQGTYDRIVKAIIQEIIQES